MATAILQGGPCDGDRVEVELDWFLPPGYITVVAWALDEQAETVEWTEAGYRRRPSRDGDPGHPVSGPWAYVYSGPD